MKAKRVFENIEFERNVDVKDALGLGSIQSQKESLDNLLIKIEEFGIDTTFHQRLYDPQKSDTSISASVDIPTTSPNKFYYSIHREKNNNRWEFVVYYNIIQGWNEKKEAVFNSSNPEEILLFVIDKSKEGYMNEINKINKTILTFEKKRKDIQNKIDNLK